MSPSHTCRRGRIYRYYVTREAIADGYDTGAVTGVPAADVEGAVPDQVQKLLAAPELVARTWAAKWEGEDEITEREITILLADFATVWNELFPAEQARIVQLLVEQVDVREEALEVRIRAEGPVIGAGAQAASPERSRFDKEHHAPSRGIRSSQLLMKNGLPPSKALSEASTRNSLGVDVRADCASTKVSQPWRCRCRNVSRRSMRALVGSSGLIR